MKRSKQLNDAIKNNIPLSPELARRVRGLIIRAASHIGTAVMLLATLPLLTYALQTLLPEDPLKSYTVVVPQREMELYFIIVSLLLLLCGVCALFKLREAASCGLRLDADAAFAYGEFFFEREAALPTCLYSAVSIAVGLILALTLPEILISELVLPFICVELLTFGLGIRELVSFFLRRAILSRIDTEGDRSANARAEKKRRGAALWVIYWLVVIAVYTAASIVFGSFMLYLYIPLIALVLFALFYAADRGIERRSGKKRFLLLLRRASVCCIVVLLCVLAVICGSYLNSAYICTMDYEAIDAPAAELSYDPVSGVYTLRGEMSPDGGELRILQLTDIHYCGSFTTIFPDRMALDTCFEMIQKAQPDLIIVTGDIVYPIPAQSFTLNNLNALEQFADFMGRVGIPWAVVFGNHDTEESAIWSGEDISRYLSELRNEDKTLLYADKQPDIYGRYNQYIRLENSDGSLNRVLYLMDTNDYAVSSEGKKVYDSVHSDQVRWYSESLREIAAAEGETVPSFVFMHIPMPAYAEAYAALQSGCADAEYLFGENEENFGCSESDNGMFAAMLEGQSTEAVFAGHDHLNNAAIRYKGIDLVYSKSIDCIAYPGIADRSSQRGATLIHVYYDGYRIEQINAAE